VTVGGFSQLLRAVVFMSTGITPQVDMLSKGSLYPMLIMKATGWLPEKVFECVIHRVKLVINDDHKCLRAAR
jgi:hypothetical protein